MIQDGWGYVWIIRIYLIIAILLPIIVFILDRFSKKYVVIVSIVIYILYEYMCHIGIFNINIIFTNIIAYIIPCAIIITISYYIRKSSNNKIIIFSLLNFVIFIVLGIYYYKRTGEIKNTNFMKYPFRLYYISYGLSISCLLIRIFRNNNIVNFIYNKLIFFVSKSSLWIYLWHIFFIYISKVFFTNINWVFKYIFILISSCLIVYLQKLIC